MDNSNVVGLHEAIDSLRKELYAAAALGEDEPMRFALDSIDLEVKVALTKEANGKIAWKLLGIGPEVSGKVQHAATQTLTVHLVPLWKAKNGKMTRDFSIALEYLPGHQTAEGNTGTTSEPLADLGIGPEPDDHREDD